MEKIKSFCKNNMWLLAGVVLTFLSCTPFIIMGENSIIQYNDQLDGELITYILNAKHLFENTDVYPEIMNGIPKAGMVSPAPLFVLLFKFFKPFTAFLIMLICCKTASFVSIYLLNSKLTGKKSIGFITGIVFMMIQFYPVYGLSIPGQAFLWWSILILLDKESSKNIKITAYLMTALYAMTSSLPLVGFGLVAVIFIISVVSFLKDKKTGVLLLINWVILTGIYLLLNLNLVKQIFGIGYKFTSHKSEITSGCVGFFNDVKMNLLGSDPYTACYQKYILVFVLIAFILSFLIYKDKKKYIKNNIKVLWISGFIALIILIAGLYNLSFVQNMKNNATGVFREFNFERITWMLPPNWFAILGLAMSELCESFKRYDKKIVKSIPITMIILVSLIVFCKAGLDSDTKVTVMKMIKGAEYKQVTFGQFYSSHLFDEVEKVIGKDRSEIKVVSMGFLPAMASYNGFYCLDAYSNNYDVEYKHEFRNIISKELDKSDYYKSYYDDWGNRCYIYLANYKTGINAYFYNMSFYDIDIDFEQVKKMGADYVLSASPIIDFDKYGLKLLNTEPIGDENDWYWIYVYEIL